MKAPEHMEPVEDSEEIKRGLLRKQMLKRLNIRVRSTNRRKSPRKLFSQEEQTNAELKEQANADLMVGTDFN